MCLRIVLAVEVRLSLRPVQHYLRSGWHAAVPQLPRCSFHLGPGCVLFPLRRPVVCAAGQTLPLIAASSQLTMLILGRTASFTPHSVPASGIRTWAKCVLRQPDPSHISRSLDTVRVNNIGNIRKEVHMHAE